MAFLFKLNAQPARLGSDPALAGGESKLRAGSLPFGDPARFD